MSPTQATPVAALRRLAGSPLDAGADEELLRKFCADRDEAAFAVIVRRHGGLVLDVCRAVLRNDADAEDCFQTTFVALAADARRMRRPAALAGWLHAVAYRTAGKARRARLRRRAHEAQVPTRPDANAPDPSWAEVREAIHEEVNHLPDRYRSAVVLYYLTGQTQDEVGQALGLSTAGAKKRLERGRAMLRSALDRRGFGPTVVLAAAAITLPAPSAALTASAAELAVRFVTNRGDVPATILSLLPDGVRPMTAKIAFGAVAVLGIAGTVGFGMLRGGPGDQANGAGDPPVVAQAKQPETPAAPKTPKGSGPPSAALLPIERFRALEPGERLKFVEKVGGDAAFTAAKRDDLTAAVVERGSLEAVNYSDVVCKVKAKDKDSPATTIKWVVDEGSVVKKGDRLMVLDHSAIVEQLQVATVKAKEAEAAFMAAEQDIRIVKEECDVEIRLAEIDIELVKAGFKEGSKELFDLKVEQAKLKLAKVRARAKGQITKAEVESRARKAAWDIEVQRQGKIEADLKACELVAPMDGFVVYYTPASGRLQAVIAAGESVREGQKLLRVTDLKQMAIGVRVHEAIISTVRVGQTAEVRVDAFPGKVLQGKVTHVSALASAPDWMTKDIKVYPVSIAIEDPPRGLKPGMSGEAQIATGERKAVLQVPLKAVATIGKDRICFVKSGQEVIERKVIPGASNASHIEIRDGLKEGDQVVTDLNAIRVKQ